MLPSAPSVFTIHNLAFQGSFDKTSLTNDVWRPNWLYIHENGTAPLLIGEWGGRLGQDADQRAMRLLIGIAAAGGITAAVRAVRDAGAHVVLDRVRAGEEDPPCLECGGILKSATISFGQALVPDT